MTYSEFVNSLSNGVNLFVDSLSSFLNSLIHNYFIITLLGLGLFVYLFYLIIHLIRYFVDGYINKYLEYDDKYHNYKLLQKVKHDYLDKNRLDVYSYLYDYKVLQYQVLNGIYQKNPQILLENKIMNFQLSADSLKYLKLRNVSDEHPYNDNDADMFSNIPVPPVQMSDSVELKLHKNKPFSYEELHAIHESEKNDINNKIDSLISEFGSSNKSNVDLLKENNKLSREAYNPSNIDK